MPAYTVAQLAEQVNGTVEGDGDRTITGAAPVESAGAEDLAFVTGPRYARYLKTRTPGAVLIPQDLELETPGTALIRVPNPRLAFGRLLALLYPEDRSAPAVDPTARLGRGVRLGRNVSVGPFACVGDRARIGDGTRIGAFVWIEPDVSIGRDCLIGPSCSLLRGTCVGDRVRLHPGVRLGTEGFGFVAEAEEPVKVPQIGGCVVEDDVEIGANTTVDRGALGNTRIGAGTKIDNLVHVGHNVEIGRNCIVVAQVGIAGSSKVGDGVLLAGQAGIADHLEIGAGARIAAQAGVIGNVPPGATYSGYPARPHRDALRASASLFRLPGILRKLTRVERRLAALEKQLEKRTASSGGEPLSARSSSQENR